MISSFFQNRTLSMSLATSQMTFFQPNFPKLGSDLAFLLHLGKPNTSENINIIIIMLRLFSQFLPCLPKVSKTFFLLFHQNTKKYLSYSLIKIPKKHFPSLLSKYQKHFS